jgi:hypothetical protein
LECINIEPNCWCDLNALLTPWLDINNVAGQVSTTNQVSFGVMLTMVHPNPCLISAHNIQLQQLRE